MTNTHGSNLRILALEKEIEELKAARKVKKDQFSHIVQMIILEYLGIGENIENDKKRAEVYAPLIRRDVETTRQYFYKLGEEKTIYNLEIVRDYFEKAGLNKLMKQVQEEIDRKKLRGE